MGDMRKSLLLFILSALAVSVAAASCSDKPPKLVARQGFERADVEDSVPLFEVTQELQDVRYSRSKGDELQWRLEAKTVAQTTDGPVQLESVEITYYADEDRTTIVTADAGIYDHVGQDATLSGNVTVTTSDGGRVETSTIHWDQKEQVLTGEGEVTISRGGSTIRGTGFELFPAAETVRIYQVGGVIHQGDMGL